MKCPKKYRAKPPVTRLLESRCDLPDGRSFTFVTDLPEKEFISIGEQYLSVAKKPSEMGIIMACKFIHPKCICVTKEQYNQMTKGKVGHATKEEWENENN